MKNNLEYISYMSLKGAENLTLCGKDDKKYVVTEMYYNNVTERRAFEV